MSVIEPERTLPRLVAMSGFDACPTFPDHLLGPKIQFGAAEVVAGFFGQDSGAVMRRETEPAIMVTRQEELEAS